LKLKLFFICFFCCLFSFSVFAYEIINLNDIDIKQNSIIINKSPETNVWHTLFDNPYRIVIDLIDAEFEYSRDSRGTEIRDILIYSDYIDSIRTSQFDEGRARIVIDLTGLYQYDVELKDNKIIFKMNIEQPLAKEVIEPETPSPKQELETASKPKDSQDYLNQKIDLLELREVDIKDALRLIAKEADLNLILSDDIREKVHIRLSNITIATALELILSNVGYTYQIDDNILRVLRISETIRDSETRIFNVRFANIDNIFSIIRNTFRTTVSVEKDVRTNSLIISGSESALDEISKVISDLDKMPEYKGTELVTVVFTLAYSKADDVKNIINQIIVTQQFDDVTVNPQQQPPSPANYPMPNASDNLPIFQGKTNVVIDERTNSLIITTNYPENITAIREIIEKLDKPVPQVLIEAQFIEVNAGYSKKIGIDWAGGTGSDKSIGQISAEVTDGVLSVPIGEGWNPTYGTLNVDQLTLFFNALQSKANAKILSSPRVTTLNNKTALIRITESIITETVTLESEVSTTLYNQPIRAEVGITLEVTPYININDFITMELRPSVNEARRSNFASNSMDILKREAHTNVVVRDGETIILGGLVKRKDSDSRRGLPWLSKIPLIKNFFSSDIQEEEETELLIFVTPYIIREDSQRLRDEIEKLDIMGK
jgi:type II secretion system protein D